MSQPSVLVVDTNPARAAVIEGGLRAEGITRVHTVSGTKGLAARIEELEPDVIVVDLGNPNRDMLENMLQLTRAVKKPVAMFVDQSDREAMEKAIDAGVSAYVVDGFKKERVRVIMDMAISRFNAFSRMEEELEAAKSALSDRKIIDRAKGMVMQSRGLSEDEAYALMRKSAMNQNRRIVDIARSLVMTADILDIGDHPHA